MFATFLAATATLYLAAGVLLFAARTPGYSHVQHTISELARWAPLINGGSHSRCFFRSARCCCWSRTC